MTVAATDSQGEAEHVPVEGPARKRPRVPRIVAVLSQAGFVGLVSLGYAVWIFKAWRQSFWVALVAGGSDHLQIAAIVRSIHDTGWYFTNPNLGAPFHQQLYDFPLAGESTQILVIRFLTLFSSRPFWVMNVYFLAGFAFLAATTYLVLAHFRFRFSIAAPVALLYTWLPFHLMHGEFHLFRSMYLSAPLAILLMVWLLSWKDRFLIDPSGGVWGIRRLWANAFKWRLLGALALCVFIGTFETMVMAFTLVALVVTGLISAIRNHDVGDLVAVLCAGVVIAGAYGVMFIPNYRFKAENGPNHVAAIRYPSEQTSLGLQLASMILPVPDHHVKALANLLPRSQENTLVPGEGGQNLGTLGTLGFFGLLYGVVVWRFGERIGDAYWDRRRLWAQASTISFVLIIFAVMSGFALVLSVLGFSQVRVWDRAVVLIAFCAFIVFAIGLERLHEIVRAKWNRRTGANSGRASRIISGSAAWSLALVITCFGFWDTNTQYSSSVTNKLDHQQAMELRKMNDQIVSKIGPRGMIFQVPVIPFPEAPKLYALQDYEEFLPYLYADKLRFSYGAMRGRPDADWQLKVNNHYPTAKFPALVGLGFDGILLDRAGYIDKGDAQIKKISRVLGPPIVKSDDDRWQFWSFKDYAQKKHLSQADLRAAATKLVGTKLMKRLDSKQ